MRKVVSMLLCLALLASCSRETYQESPQSTPAVMIQTPSPMPNQETQSDPHTEAVLTPVDSFEEWQQLYTSSNPTQDPAVIKSILSALLENYYAQFNNVGWYRFQFRSGTYERNFLVTTWVHINDPATLGFDMLMRLYDHPRYAAGVIVPVNLLTPSGDRGSAHITTIGDDYQFEPINDNFLSLPESNLHHLNFYTGEPLEEMASFGDKVLQKAIRLLDNPFVTEINGNTQDHSFSAWFERLEDQPAFVLNTVTVYGGTLPMTESGERLKSSDNLNYFNLNNGGEISLTYTWHYLSGKSDTWNNPTDYDQVQWFEVLPEAEQLFYDEACTRLEEFNQTQEP
ncbi:MAG: hypothetical protein IMZ61_15510 [Planctomycetes bacterium]|nr:hypothetical protein [Planctomycetota bacterium]